MRIAFDLRPVHQKSSRRRGIGKYTHQLAGSLLVRGGEAHDFIFYGSKGPTPELGGRFGYRELFRLAKPSRLAWVADRLVLPRQLHQDRADLFHATDIFSIAFANGTKTIVTVHDLIPLIFWEQTAKLIPWDVSLSFKSAWRRIRRCDFVLTSSRHSKIDICERLGVPEEKVAVVYPGCNPVFVPRDPTLARDQIRKTHGIQRNFLLYVGGSDFRKNLINLLAAFRDIRRRGYSGDLVLAGETFLWDIAEVRDIRKEVERLGLQSSVLFPGYVSDQDLNDFYCACDMFVFPSAYEGFGLPVLEALKCGAVVIAARTSSVPEVAGEAAEYFDPMDSASLVRCFESLYADKVRQCVLREKGLAQAGLFSWPDSAREILAIYETLA
jgi:glycosyltransferase involved in cell wall biosynthesis